MFIEHFGAQEVQEAVENKHLAEQTPEYSMLRDYSHYFATIKFDTLNHPLLLLTLPLSSASCRISENRHISSQHPFSHLLYSWKQKTPAASEPSGAAGVCYKIC